SSHATPNDLRDYFLDIGRTTPALHCFPTRRSSDLPFEFAAFDSVARFVETLWRIRKGRFVVRLQLDWAAKPATTAAFGRIGGTRSEEHTSEVQSPCNLVCRLLFYKKCCVPAYGTAH